LLLPPSEGKAEGGDGDGWVPDLGAFAHLAPRREQVLQALLDAGGGDAKLLGVKGAHLDRARSANLTLIEAPTLPAWQRYTGVVWDHLDPATLPAASRRRIVVVSGLHGLVRGDDPLPDYRLKMGANLPPLGKLSTWWRPAVSDALCRFAAAATSRPRFLVDLLPNEHAAAWAPDSRVRGVRVDLLDRSGKPGGHAAKAAKGRLARLVLTEGLDALDGFTDDRFDLSVTPIRDE
jgi:cytoplasmic iron level regulating protein YaaA (DUF328/UPF0246 family)